MGLHVVSLALFLAVAGCIEGPAPEPWTTQDLTVCPVPVGAGSEPARQFRVGLTRESVDLLVARGLPTTVIVEVDVWRDNSLCGAEPQASPGLVVAVVMESERSETEVQGFFRYRTDLVFERFELPVLQDCPRDAACEDIVSLALSRQDSNEPRDLGVRLRALTETFLDRDDRDQVTIELERIEL